MASTDLILPLAADGPLLRAQLLDTIHLLDAARAHLQEALSEEGDALVGACDAVNASGAVSPQAVKALRSAQAAHARSIAAAGEVRALNAQADRANAAAEMPGAGFASRLAVSPYLPRRRSR